MTNWLKIETDDVKQFFCTQFLRWHTFPAVFCTNQDPIQKKEKKFSFREVATEFTVLQNWNKIVAFESADFVRISLIGLLSSVAAFQIADLNKTEALQQHKVVVDG